MPPRSLIPPNPNPNPYVASNPNQKLLKINKIHGITHTVGGFVKNSKKLFVWQKVPHCVCIVIVIHNTSIKNKKK